MSTTRKERDVGVSPHRQGGKTIGADAAQWIVDEFVERVEHHHLWAQKRHGAKSGKGARKWSKPINLAWCAHRDPFDSEALQSAYAILGQMLPTIELNACNQAIREAYEQPDP